MSKKRVSSYDDHPFRIEWLAKAGEAEHWEVSIPRLNSSLVGERFIDNTYSAMERWSESRWLPKEVNKKGIAKMTLPFPCSKEEMRTK